MSKNTPQNKMHSILIDSVQELIKQSKQQLAVTINATMTQLYWEIGSLVNKEILHNKRAEYGKQIVSSLSTELTKQYGKGWSEKQIRHCLRFAETIPDFEIVSTLQRQLSWSHIKSLIYMDDPLKRSFYIEMCKMEKWSTRTMQERINSMLYERTAISKKPEETIKSELETKLTILNFRISTAQKLCLN